MKFRAKLLLACLPLALAPLAYFGLRVRDEVTVRLGAQYAERVASLADVIEADLARESAAVDARLERIARALAADNRFRRSVLDGRGGERGYLLDYAGQAMALGGLDVLRLQDERGRVLSSGHFRNEYDAVDPELPQALERADGRGALVAFRTASGSMLALARTRHVTVGTRTLTLVGGTAIDSTFLDRMARGTGLEVRLEIPGEVGGGIDGEAGTIATSPTAAVGAAPPAGRGGSGAGEGDRTPDGDSPPARSRATGYTREVVVRYVDAAAARVDAAPSGINAAGAGASPDEPAARFIVRATTAPVDTIRRDLDRWLAAMLAITGVLAAFLALVVATRLARPLTELAHRAARLDLDRLDVTFETGRADEIGALSRVLDRATYRLRVGAARLREAERRATVGEIARQVNHDVRNGLVPIRNVVNHLAELARERPDELPTVFLERQHTLESSVAYLHDLAGNYARLSPVRDTRPCDVNAIVRETVRDTVADSPAAGHCGSRATGPSRLSGAGSGPAGAVGATRVATDLAPRLPAVHADPVALRRIVENLVVNAVESLEGDGGRVTVATRLERTGEAARIRLVVADTGRGMNAEERARIFQDFYTTKPRGTGLGLSIVRRLVSDLGGRITVESEPGAGTRFVVELPVAIDPTPAPERQP